MNSHVTTEVNQTMALRALLLHMYVRPNVTISFENEDGEYVSVVARDWNQMIKYAQEAEAA